MLRWESNSYTFQLGILTIYSASLKESGEVILHSLALISLYVKNEATIVHTYSGLL